MSKQVEVPEGVNWRTLGELLADPEVEGKKFFAEDDLPAIYKHFSDRLLSDEAKQAAIKGLSYRLGHTLNEAAVACVLEEALQAISIPTTSDEES